VATGNRALVLLVLLGVGCSSMRSDRHAPGSDVVGCCCAYDNCAESLTNGGCARRAEFQGWTYTWHQGPCTDADTYPAPDHPANRPAS
jgi:hypothetical protein